MDNGSHRREMFMGFSDTFSGMTFLTIPFCQGGLLFLLIVIRVPQVPKINHTWCLTGSAYYKSPDQHQCPLLLNPLLLFMVQTHLAEK